MNCLRCGRTVPDQILLCQTCLAEKDKPVKAKIEPLQEEVQKQQIKTLLKKNRGLRRGLAFFVLLALAAAVMLGGLWYIMGQQNDRIAAQTSRINSLETAMEETRNELAQTNTRNETLTDALATAQQTIDRYAAVTGLSPEEIATVPVQPEE